MPESGILIPPSTNIIKFKVLLTGTLLNDANCKVCEDIFHEPEKAKARGVQTADTGRVVPFEVFCKTESL